MEACDDSDILSLLSVKKNDTTLGLIVTSTASLICLLLFLYSRSHWPAGYRPSGYRITPVSDVFGAAFLFLLVRFLFALRGK